MKLDMGCASTTEEISVTHLNLGKAIAVKKFSNTQGTSYNQNSN